MRHLRDNFWKFASLLFIASIFLLGFSILSSKGKTELSYPPSAHAMVSAGNYIFTSNTNGDVYAWKWDEAGERFTKLVAVWTRGDCVDAVYCQVEKELKFGNYKLF